MAYPEKPSGIEALNQFDKDGKEYNFADSDNKKNPMDEILFTNGYKNADESENDITPSAHEHNWLFNLFYKNIRYCIGTSEENKSIIANNIKSIQTINETLVTKASNSELQELKKVVNNKSDINLTNSLPSSTFIDKTTGWIVPNYKEGITLSPNVDYKTNYTGIVVWDADFAKNIDKVSAVGNGTDHFLSIDGIKILTARYKWSTYTKYFNKYTQSIAVRKGSIINFTRGTATFYPCK